jgi:hypothetical protein
MAAINKDFVVKNGIVIEGDSEVTSSTNQIDALQVDGGVGIAKNLIVGSTATIYGNVFFNQPVLPLSRSATLGSPNAPFSELYLSGNSLYLGKVVLSSTGSEVTFSSDIGSTLIRAGSLILRDITSSNSPTSGALQVAGGAGISGNLYVGSDAELQQTLSVTGTSMFYSTISVEGIASFNNSTLATSSGNGAVEVTGGVRINNNLVVMSTASNTGTLETNAIYVEGGVGIKGGLAVSGSAVFKNDVYFQGATTYVYSTNTVYTDNLIELHVPPAGAWTFDDGKDIGFRFHYYNNADWNAALIVANDSKKLEFYKNGSEVNGAFVGVYGDFKTGTLQLVNTATSISTTTGALTVAGGVGIAGNLVVAGGISGTITRAINLTGGVKGSIPIQSSTGTTTFIAPGTGNSQVLTWDPATSTAIWGTNSAAGTANTASNILGGYPGAIVYQLNTGSTTFLIGSDAEYILTYNTGTHAPQWTNPAEYVVGYANTATTSTWASTASYAINATSATFATTASQSNYALFADSATTATTSTYASTSTYANIAFTSTYANIAFTSTYANTATTATYANIAFTSTYANIAFTATYADIAFTSTYASTSNYSAVAGTSTYANIAFTSTYASTSNYAAVAGTSTYSNIAFTASWANTVSYAIVAGTSTYASTANYAFTSTWADTSTNISGGTVGSILYQSTTGTTVSLPLGNAGEILSADVSAPKWVSVSGLSAAYATSSTNAIYADNIRTRYQSASLTYYPTFVADNNFADNYEPLFTTSSFNINPSSGLVNIGGKLVVGSQIWAATSSTLGLLSTEDFSIARSVDPTFGAVYNALPYDAVWLQTIGTRDEKIWLENNRKGSSVLYVNYDSRGALNFGDRWYTDKEFVSLYPNTGSSAFEIKVTNFVTFPTSFTTSTWSFGANGNLTAPGKIIVNSTASSTSTTTGALTVIGGVGIRGDVYVGGNIYSRSYEVITTATINDYANQTIITAGTDTAINTSTGNITIWNTGTLQSVSDRGNSTTNIIVINNDTSATSTITGAFHIVGGAGVGGDIYVGGALHAATTSYVNNSKILVAQDLETVTFTATYITNDPTSQTGLAAIANTTTVYGTYNFGTVGDISTINDYNTSTNTGFYSINDAAGAPAYIVYIGFSNVSDFTRLVLNVNYTANSGHTVEIDLYNYVTLTWDTLTTYSGSTNWFQFILGIIDSAPYLSTGKVSARIYHVSSGNTAHRTWVDYAALENSVQGGQGPRGATGATGAQGIQGLTTTTTSTFTFTNSTDSTSTTTGAVVVTGGVGIGKSLFVGSTATILSTASSTATLQANALYVAGGIGAGSLFVQGPATFNSNVVFNGTYTYVLSTNTVYTDNIIELHYPNNPSNTWAVNDSNDIGLRFHYYDTTDRNAFFGRDNTTGYLEWLVNSSADNTNNVTGTNGTFRLGSIILTDSTASSSTSTGALTVVGGVGIGGALYVGQASYIAGAQILTTATVNQYASQTTIFAGTDTAVNTSTGAVTIWNTSSLQSVTSRGATTDVAVSITNSTASSSTSTGALVVAGGVGINKGLYVGGTVTATSFVGVATTATNIANGAAGSLPYQSATGTTTFLSIGTNGYVLTSNGTGPTWSAISGLSAGNSTTATNLANGTAGQVPYQTSAGATSFYGPGTAGQILLSSGTNAPVYTNTSSIYVGKAVLADTATLANNATTATNIAGGTAGQLVYQTGPGATSFAGPGTAGNVLVSNGTSAPTYNNTLTLSSTITSVSTTTGALQVRGGVGVADSVYVGNRVGFVGTTQASVVYQYYNTLTNSLDTVFG